MDSWDQHKDILRAQYSSKTLQSLMVHMEVNFSFIKSKGQYERQFKKWGFRKNSTSGDWNTIHGKIQKRQNQGKKSAVYKSGKHVRVEKLNKEKRHNFRKLGEPFDSRRPAETTCCVESYCRHATVEPPKTPEGYTVCTPMGGETAPPLLINNLPSLQLFAQLKSFVIAHRNASQHPRQRNTDNLRGNLPAAFLGTAVGKHWFATQIVPSASKEGTISAEISGEEDRDDGSDLDLTLIKEWKLDGTSLKDLFQVSRTGELSPSILSMLHQASNNLLSRCRAPEVVNAICLGGGRRLFNSLISTRSPATQAIARSLLPAAMQSLDVGLVRSLLDTGISPDAPMGYSLQTPLQFAIVEVGWSVGILDLIQLLLDYGAQVNLPCAENTHSPLVYAARRGIFGLVQLLLTAGADVNAHASTDETTALQAAAGAYVRAGACDATEGSYRFEIARLLLTAGADVNATPHSMVYGETALQVAVRHGNVALVQMLLSRGADVNTPAVQDRTTALQTAASTGNLEIFDLLLTWGASDVCNTIDAARGRGHSQAAKVLISFGAGLYDAGNKAYDRIALRSGIQFGDYNVVRGLLNSDVDLEARTGVFETTALQEAAMLGNIDLSSLLISFGANVNAFAGGESGETALQFAARAGNTELVRLLLDAGADINSKPSRQGMMALEAAVVADSFEIVQLLLDAGADIYVQGAAAIMEAIWHFGVSNNSPAIVQLLLDHFPSSGVHSHEDGFDHRAGYSIDCELMPLLLQYGVVGDNFALRYAFLKRDLDLVELALDFGADVNAGQEYDGNFWILEEAMCTVGPEAVQLLLEHGVNSPGKARALQFAAYHGSFRYVELLIRAGGDVNAAPLHYCINYYQTERRTALQAAAQHGHLHIVRLLLEEGAEVERSSISEDEEGTALQFAAISGSIAIANELIQKGANVNAGPVGKNGRTALEGAAEHGRLDMVQLLLNLEADVRGSRALQFARREGHDGVAMLLLQNGFEDDVGMSG